MRQPLLVVFAIAISLGLSTGPFAQSANNGASSMTGQQAPAPQVPPEVLRYIKEPEAESKQFDFLIGDWDVDAIRYKEDGSPLFKYKASWSAMRLNGGRMIMDDYKALGPTGQPVSSFVTLRTYSEVTNRWELVGLQALQPAMPSEWHGVAKDGEMFLDATARTPAGDTVKTKIRFFNIATDSFSWESSVSLDQGQHWQKTAELTATRVHKN
jgi:hypothetical protein